MSGEPVYCSDKHDVELRSFISEGHTLGAYSGMTGIPMRIIHSWLKKHSSFADAYETGYHEGCFKFESAGMKQLENPSMSFDYKMYTLLRTHFKGDRQAMSLIGGTATQKMERLLGMIVEGAVSPPAASSIVAVCDRLHGYTEFEEAKNLLEKMKEKIG